MHGESGIMRTCSECPKNVSMVSAMQDGKISQTILCCANSGTVLHVRVFAGD